MARELMDLGTIVLEWLETNCLREESRLQAIKMWKLLLQ